MSAVSFLNSLAPVLLVACGFGVIFRIIRVRSVFFVILCILLMPVVASVVLQSFSAGFSWKVWLILIFAALITARIAIDRVFRRR